MCLDKEKLVKNKKPSHPACPHDLFNACEECYTDGQREPEQPKAKCECVDDYWITDICEYHGYPSFCCYCGNPLKEKEEKS